MSKLDKQKEFIGYLKVIFSILVAIDISLIAWLFKNTDTISLFKNIIGLFITIFITYGIILTNRKILSKIDNLEDL